MACTDTSSLGCISASEWRERRRCWEAERLQADLHAVAAIHPNLRLIPTDHRIHTLLQHFALHQVGLAVVTVEVGTRSAVMIGVGRGVWYSGFARPKLFALKREARRSGLTLMLVPQGAVRRQPRLSTARLIASCSVFKISASTRAAIIGHVATTPDASLWSCCEVVGDPKRAMGFVLAVIAEGVLTVSPDQPLNSSSPVRFRVAHPLTIPSAAEDSPQNPEQVLPIITDNASE